MARRRTSRKTFPSDQQPPGAMHTLPVLCILIGLFLCLQGMVILFAGTRFWASGPFLAPILLFCAVSSGLMIWWNRSEPGRLPLSLEYAGLLLLAVYAAIRAVFASAIPYETWTEAYLLACAAGIWFVGIRIGTSRNGTLWLSMGMLIAGVLHSMVAMHQHLNDDRSVLWLVRPVGYGMRASGTYICPNHFAHFLQIALILSVAMLLSPKLKLSIKIFAGYAALMMIPAMVLTLSRSGLLGAVAGCGVVISIAAVRKSWKRFLWVSAGGGVLSLGFFAALYTFYPAFQHRLQPNDTLRNIRTQMIWPDTWSMIQEEGIWGSAPGTFLYAFEPYREEFDAAHLYLEYAHNEFLHLLAEYGWIPFALLIAGTLWVLIRLSRVALTSTSDRVSMLATTSLGLWIGALVHAVFDFNLHITANALLLVLILAAHHGALAIRGAWKKGFQTPVGATPWVSGAMAVLALLLLVPTVPLTIGNYHAYRSRLAWEDQDAERAFAHAALQRKWLPSRYDGWTRLGQDKHQQAFWLRDRERKTTLISEGLDAYQEALKRNPYDRISRRGVVELYKLEQHWEEALGEVNLLVDLAPFDVKVRIQKGLILKKLSRDQEALEVFQEAKRMNRGLNRQIETNLRILSARLTAPSG